MKPKQLITAWSPSRFSLWEQCAFRAFCKFILKLPDPGGPAMDRGILIHKAAEQYVNGQEKRLSPDLAKVKELITALRKEFKAGRVVLEAELAFDSAWRKVDWFSREAWARFKLDVLWRPKKGPARIVDWKTGKYKPHGEYDDQLNCYAFSSLLAFPEIEAAKGQLVFTDQTLSDDLAAPNPVERPAGTLIRAELPAAQKRWEKKVKPMLSDTTYTPCPGDGCRWCPYSKARKGPCKF